MADKRSRKKHVSSGARKAARTERQLGRRSRPIANQAHRSFLKIQDRDRVPDDDVCDKYASLNKKKHQPGPGRSRPAPLGMPLLEALLTSPNPADWKVHEQESCKNVIKLLVAASLKIKRVKRHPGWILQRTYNHKNRPITIV